MKFGSVIALIVAMLFAMPLAAKEKAEPAVNANTKDSFDAVSTWVRKEMGPTGRYSYVTAAERSKVDAKLDDMGKLFEKNADVAQMSIPEKTAMINNQEEINAILAKRDNDRLVCKMENPTGSHIPVKTCQTAGDIEARRRNDSQYLLRNQATHQIKVGKIK